LQLSIILTAMTSPRVIVFDLLTALLDSWSLWNAAAGDDTAGYRWRTRYLEITFACGAYQPYEQLVEQAAQETGLTSDAATTLLATWDQLQPWAEVPEVLQSLKARGYRLAVVTNCSAQLGHRAAARCGVVFDAVVTAQESGFYKPHPKAYQAILDQLGIAHPSEALFVAGSNGDVKGAAAAGMSVVWHNRVGLPMLPGPAPLVEGQSLRQVLCEWLGYKGLQRSEISTPTLYLNRRKFAANCKRMHERAAAMNATFRVHIKTHKTVEGTEEQLRGGDGRIVCSTLKEIEFVEPLIKKGTVRSVSGGKIDVRLGLMLM
jgi:2-haloacid dehalogenase